MERHFYRRGRRIGVTQFDDVVAVKRADTDNHALDVLRRAPSAWGDDEQAPAIDLPPSDRDALESAGWRLVRITDAVRSADALDRALAADESARVFQDGDRVLLGTQELTVQFRSDMERSPEEILDELGAEIRRELRFAPNQYEVVVREGGDALDVANALHESGHAIYAEPTFVEVIEQRFTPTDPTYPRQWHLDNDGSAGGVAGADISAERAWDYTRGAGVCVAVIDNGFDVGHADLTDGIVDESGFFDGGGAFRRTLTSYPDDDHGTFCAGMVGARQNNDQDGCGSAPEADLMLVATQNDQIGTQATLARAIAYAADPSMEVDDASPDDGADVISCSLGPSRAADWALTSVLENALLYATRSGRRGLGTVVLWASSNGNVDIARDDVVSHPVVIAVGRSRRNDREDNSARGEELDFLAPGTNVVSTGSGGGTRTDTGTSFATPLAAGVAALMLAVNPNLAWADAREILRRSCDKIGGVTYDRRGHNLDYGHGRVNAYRAVIESLHARTSLGSMRADLDRDDRDEVPIRSPWGLGALDFTSGGLASGPMAANGTSLGGWRLDTSNNRFPLIGDFDGDGRDELLVTSPWGIGVLRANGGSFSALMLEPNGTRFGGWLLNTAGDLFGPVGDFDGDGRDEILIRSGWGVAILKLTGSTFSTLLIERNGTPLGSWRVNTVDNAFGPVGDFDGDGRDELLVRSPWGFGMLELDGATAASPVMVRNGTRVDGWLVNTGDNWLGPVGDFGGSGRDDAVVASGWGIGIMSFAGGAASVTAMAENGTALGSWRINTHDNRLQGAADFDGDGADEILITSPWGLGILERTGTGGLSSVMLAPNGTRFGGWNLNTADNHFRRLHDVTGDNRADIVVESPWGIGVMSFNGTTLDVPFMEPNGTWLGSWNLNTHDNRLW